jgi:hypothetical protein
MCNRDGSHWFTRSLLGLSSCGNISFNITVISFDICFPGSLFDF